MKLESRFYDLVPFKDFERVFGKIKIMEVSMKASGKIKFIKTTDTRRAILLDSDERWFGIFSNTKGFAGANEVVKNIDENLSKGDYVEMEVVKTDKGFWNIRSVERVDDYSEGKEESPPDEEEPHEEESLYTATEPMAKKPVKKSPPKDPTQDSIENQSAYKTAFGNMGQIVAAAINAQLFSTIDDAVEYNNIHGRALACAIIDDLRKD